MFPFVIKSRQGNYGIKKKVYKPNFDHVRFVSSNIVKTLPFELSSHVQFTRLSMGFTILKVFLDICKPIL